VKNVFLLGGLKKGFSSFILEPALIDTANNLRKSYNLV